MSITKRSLVDMPAQRRGESSRGKGVRTKQTAELVANPEDGVYQQRLKKEVVSVLEVGAEQPPLRIRGQDGGQACEPGGKLQDASAADVVLDRVLPKLTLQKTTATISVGKPAVRAPAVPHSADNH